MREIHHLSHMSNLIPGRQQLNLKFSLMFKGLLPDKIFLLKSCIDFSLPLVLKEEGEKMKRRLSSFGDKQFLILEVQFLILEVLNPKNYRQK